MSSPQQGIAFVVDENLLRLGRALTHLRRDIALVGQEPISDLLPRGILDSAWIPIVGGHGWIMITNDQRIRTRPAESILAIEYKLKVIHLHGAIGMQSAWGQATRLFTRWEGVERQLSTNPDGPWWMSIRRDRVQPMRFEPGSIDRA